MVGHDDVLVGVSLGKMSELNLVGVFSCVVAQEM